MNPSFPKEPPSFPASVDVFIVGTGPVGSAFAREVHEQAPDASILMVDVGPHLTERPGENIRNLPLERRVLAERAASGPNPSAPTSATGSVRGRIAARPGTFLARRFDGPFDHQAGMPAAAMASNVGGMAAHWTCACPKPGGSERIPFVDSLFDAAFDRAGLLLGVTTAGFPETPTSRTLRSALGAIFDAGRPADRRVQPMPLACRPTGEPMPHWSGAAEVLGPLAEPDHDAPFEIAASTLCRRLAHEGGRVTGAVVEHLPSGTVATIRVGVVVVAADAFRTPQLLWASGIRPAALGRYLNDQPQIHSAVALKDSICAPDARELGRGRTTDTRDWLTGALWVPFHEPDAPYHTQVMQVGIGPIAVEGGHPSAAQVIGWGRFTAKDNRCEDRVEFSPRDVDGYGMPAMTIHYGLTDLDRANIERAITALRDEAAQIGTFLLRHSPRLLPAGSSMHYQGTVRMGDLDDGTSVCDPASRVWGMTNLFLGGNGVIPTAIACNPTATSVALAVIAAKHVVARCRES